jgi:2,4-dienoyl-CoA reductase-like NADH-dependent reductase (Old Yellow Enzyme family)
VVQDRGVPTPATLSDPLDLPHGPRWPHRIALAPLTNHQSEPDGRLGEQERDWLVRRAEGGMALTMTCAAHVSAAGQSFPGQLAVWDDRFRPGLERLARDLRTASQGASGGRTSVQLQHGGRRAAPALSGLPRVGAWEEEATGTRALSTGELEQVVADFVAAAVRCEQAGFDGVELHGAHGYLLCQFLDGRHNHRTDGYGGSAEDRSRLLREVAHEVRAATGADFQVGVRLTPERSGILLAESTALAARLAASGDVDYLDLSMWDVGKRPFEAEHSGSLLIEHLAAIERGDVPLGVAGEVRDAATAQWCLDRGVDFVLVGTGAILHHDFAARALADPGFRAVAPPVSREHLAAESVGPRFVDYLAADWDDLVA